MTLDMQGIRRIGVPCTNLCLNSKLSCRKVNISLIRIRRAVPTGVGGGGWLGVEKLRFKNLLKPYFLLPFRQYFVFIPQRHIVRYVPANPSASLRMGR